MRASEKSAPRLRCLELSSLLTFTIVHLDDLNSGQYWHLWGVSNQRISVQGLSPDALVEGWIRGIF